MVTLTGRGDNPRYSVLRYRRQKSGHSESTSVKLKKKHDSRNYVVKILIKTLPEKSEANIFPLAAGEFNGDVGP